MKPRNPNVGGLNKIAEGLGVYYAIYSSNTDPKSTYFMLYILWLQIRNPPKEYIDNYHGPLFGGPKSLPRLHGLLERHHGHLAKKGWFLGGNGGWAFGATTGDLKGLS